MFSVFRIVLILSAIGTAIALLLLLLKPATRRLFSPRWQYYIWIAVLVAMVFPLPVRQTRNADYTPPAFIMPVQTADTAVADIPAAPAETAHKKPDPRTAISYAWALGAAVYLLTALLSYWRFLIKKKRCSYISNIDISEAASRVGVKKPPKVRICADKMSPMLVGVFRPTIYLPETELDERLNLVLMHELMHYKRRDLIYKWAALIVNGIHWFNPIAYIVSSNINEQCEISCDIAVTRDMDNAEKTEYMRTILDLLRS